MYYMSLKTQELLRGHLFTRVICSSCTLPKMAFHLTHPKLGNVVGKDEHTLCRFLGIQYATLTNRLADAQLATSSSRGEIIAEKHG